VLYARSEVDIPFGNEKLQIAGKSQSFAACNPGQADGRLTLKKVRVFPKLVPREEEKQETNHPNLFLFCESSSGTAQFRATGGGDLECTVERIAGLLAMQCLVRGQNPGDFQVLVPAQQSLVARLISRTEELLKEGRAIACPTSLSARQREVLDAVVSNRANKEIASRLNITVRTVKFHVSSLLSKFGVETRAELARRAAGFMRPTLLENEARTPAQVNKGGRNLVPEQAMQKTTLAMANNSRSLRFPGRILTA
jgi:DNA-binding CsgD family transcriptional regulator